MSLSSALFEKDAILFSEEVDRGLLVPIDPAGARGSTSTVSAADLRDLLTLGGFPEPLFGGSEREARHWARGYRTPEGIRVAPALQLLGGLV